MESHGKQIMGRVFRNFAIIAIVVLVGSVAIEGLEWGRGLWRERVEVSPDVVVKVENATSTPVLNEEKEIPTLFTVGENPALTRSEIIAKTNVERTSRGLSALRENSFLNRAAERKLEDIFAQQYFDHISPQGVGPGDLVDKVGYDYVAVSENLALGSFKNAGAVVTAWMNSSGHRANILDTRMSEIGVALGKGNFKGERVWIIVQEFGKPLTDCPMVDVALRTSIERRKADVDGMERELQELKDSLSKMPHNTPEDDAVYNQKVIEYNTLVGQYNKGMEYLRLDIAAYNSQIAKFNACAR